MKTPFPSGAASCVIRCALLCLILPSCDDAADTGPVAANGAKSTDGASGTNGGQNASGGKQDTKPVHPLPVTKTDLEYEFEEWYDDFPYSLHKPPRKLGQWYDRNAQQALEKIVANLSGLCTKTAWNMSKAFFDRHLDRAVELLIEKLDESQRRRDMYAHAENILNAIGRQKDPRFAKVILRTLSHTHPGVRRAAFRALINAGDEEAVMKSAKNFQGMNLVERKDWITAAARQLGDENLFSFYREMLTKQGFAEVRGGVFDEAMKLPPKRAARLFDPIWLNLAPDLQLHVAGVMHAAGDERGTVRLRHALELPMKILTRKIVAVQGATKGDPTPMTSQLLALTNEDNEGLNTLIIAALRKIPGDTVTDTLLTLTDRRKPPLVRQLALHALKARGHTTELDALVETVRVEPEGKKFRDAVGDLVSSEYAKAVPALTERLKKGAKKAEIFYARMIARINQKESFVALREVFLRPEYVFPWRERHSNVTFLGVQFSNLSRCSSDLIELLETLPRKDYRRRAALIHALANLAGAKQEEAHVAGPIYATLRKHAFDAKEVPQIRILALEYLQKDVRLEDAMKLKARLPKEQKAIRQYFSDYLFEFF